MVGTQVDGAKFHMNSANPGNHDAMIRAMISMFEAGRAAGHLDTQRAIDWARAGRGGARRDASSKARRDRVARRDAVIEVEYQAVMGRPKPPANTKVIAKAVLKACRKRRAESLEETVQRYVRDEGDKEEKARLKADAEWNFSENIVYIEVLKLRKKPA